MRRRTYSSGSGMGTARRSVRSDRRLRNSSLRAIGTHALTSTRTEYSHSGRRAITSDILDSNAL